jgi:phosphoglycolate phosphatase-like HAD superfamily hydrolase
MLAYTKEDLRSLAKRYDTLVAIDSDGCVFDTMAVKQKDCFHPEIIRLWGLEAAEPQLRACAEFVNLASRFRGSNRFIALLKTFEVFNRRAPGVELPDTEPLRRFVESGKPLTNPALAAEVARSGDPELRRLLTWSESINGIVAEKAKDIPPFAGVREALDRMEGRSHRIICSQTPEEALVREWDEHGLRPYAEVIAGQELGTKAEHLKLVSRDRFAGDQVLMIGDAPGDRSAAQAVGACFFPILPGAEEGAWRRLLDEAYDRFLTGAYRGAYEDGLIADFDACLPDTPPWE